jgi:neurotransmitter:Na+ symporter, NSS family
VGRPPTLVAANGGSAFIFIFTLACLLIATPLLVARIPARPALAPQPSRRCGGRGSLTIFPLVFRYGMNPAQGPALVFDVLASAFAEMPGGRLVGTLFFLLLVFAALTPSIAGFEPLVAWLQQHRQVSRVRAAAVTAVMVWALGLGSMLSFNRLSAWHPLGGLALFADKTFFDVMDFLSSNVLPPVGAVLTSVLVGWRLRRTIVDEELRDTTPFAARVCVWLLRYVCPIAIAAVLASALGVRLSNA